ncbi:probable 2-oxoglutarate-dependent dioxygenase ANS [Asparagus officinalis]|uniref:probable 2-oxoglutarate-dependent dioxygenase ANS n=1 Tax=Asparagus officinalis TaxID=4686 RepID=UPI00098E062A|nr:probable 2-oxoglutarate-dependent dioxygenase ANS [Asparagus officinalis]
MCALVLYLSEREVTKTYLEEVWKLAMKLAGAISEGLGLDSNYMERVFGEGSQIVACNYYPKCPQPDLTLGVSAHTDRGGITILMENDVEGLQVRYRGKWVPVPHVAGSYLVNIGDCVEIMSNGKFKSVEHRAVVNKRRERIAVAIGNGPGYDVIVKPISELISKASKGPSHEPILFKDIRFKEYTTAEMKE